MTFNQGGNHEEFPGSNRSQRVSLLATVFAGASFAAERATKDDAIAMVKKATAFIKEQGPDKAYPEITNKAGRFIDRDLCSCVWGLDGKVHRPRRQREAHRHGPERGEKIPMARNL